MSYNCDDCVTDRSKCKDCRDNPIYDSVPTRSLFSSYIPACPLGMSDCICDPAYIKYHYPDWYMELYGNTSPEEAAERSCYKYKDTSECYDDEDK